MDIRKLTRVERNEIIKKFLESNDVGRLYKCIVANTHLKMDHIIYLASFYGISEKCCTLKDWNSQYARIIQGEKASVINDKEKNQFYYFSQSQTTAQQPVKTRTMDSLLNTLNKLTIMSITSENKAELSLIEASVRDFLFENDILSGQETDDEMIKNLAGMLASTCVDFDSSKFQPKGLAWDYKTNARFVCNLKNIYDDLENLILKKEQQVQETKKPVAQRKNQTIVNGQRMV